MCGICGMIDYSGTAKVSAGLIEKICAKMVHRGPDDGGVYIEDGLSPSVGLGHRRLKIIDLSESAHQPMCNEDESIWIVYNGEIYNFRQLRQDLEAKGHRFKSHSDTEAILHLYEQEGANCVQHLQGMFAFAIWDKNKQSLFLARDRFGKKPLLYSYKNGVFAFASEFSALIESQAVSKEINSSAISDYISFGYIPAPMSIYQDIQKLMPGHTLILNNQQIKIERYWQLDYEKKNNISFAQAKERIIELLEEAVKIRLYSDVPLGAFLSGGTDSSTVVALMAKYSPAGKVKTFSIGFDEKDFDELKYARIAAKRFNTDHREFIVKPNALEILPELVSRYGEPYADSSCIPTYYVAKKTRQYVTVALNGDGGDELFAGYERYQAIYLSRLYNRIPAFLSRGLIAPLINSIPSGKSRKNTINRLKRFLKGTTLALPERYLRWVAVFDQQLQNELYTPGFLQRIEAHSSAKIFRPYFERGDNQEILDILLRTDTNTYLPNDLLVKMDIATMANSLEARSPFLDHRLAEFVASLKVDFKMRWFVRKYLLKELIHDFVPRQNVYRAKMGFGMPISSWFRKELKGLLIDTVVSKRSLNRGYFNPDFVKNMVKEHLEQKQDFSHQLWSLLILELWHQQFIEGGLK